MGETNALLPLLAGLMSGSTSTVLLYPLDIIKVRLQVNETNYFKRTIRKTTSTESTNLASRAWSWIVWNSPFLRQGGMMIKNENAARIAAGRRPGNGWMALYQGLGPSLLGSAVSWGGYFYFYEAGKERIKRNKVQLNPSVPPVLESLDHLSAACGAGALMVILTNPLWLVKTRMQLQVTSVGADSPVQPYKSLFDAFRTIAREEGLLAFYKGSVPAMMLVSHGAVQFVAYERLKTMFPSSSERKRSEARADGAVVATRNVVERLNDSAGYLCMGACSKVIASTFTYPIQVIKSRMQQRSQGVEIIAEENAEGKLKSFKGREYKSVFDAVRRIWKAEGAVGFFKGCMPNAIRVAPNAAITFVVYESTMDAFR